MEIVELGSVAADTKATQQSQGSDSPIAPKEFPSPL